MGEIRAIEGRTVIPTGFMAQTRHSCYEWQSSEPKTVKLGR